MMAALLKSVAGRLFVSMPGPDGRQRTLPPLEAIGQINAQAFGAEAELSALRIQVSDAQQAIRRTLMAGGDTQPIRDQITALEREQTALVTKIAELQRGADQIRQAVIDAEAGRIFQSAFDIHKSALADLAFEDFQ